MWDVLFSEQLRHLTSDVADSPGERVNVKLTLVAI